MRGAPARRTMRTLLATFVVLAACTEGSTPDLGGPADIAGDDKMDGGPGIEAQARIAGGDNVDAMPGTAIPRRGYGFYAAQDAKAPTEIPPGGTEQGLETLSRAYGRRLQ